MFDNQASDNARRPFQVVSIGHLAREGSWGVDAPRSYLVPVLLWFTAGQGRVVIDGQVRGYNAHNAIYLPPNSPIGCDVGLRTQGSAIFFGGHNNLPLPSEIIHLRLHGLQKQAELNQHVERLNRGIDDHGPFRDEVQYHQASLILLWLAREAHGPVRALPRPADQSEDDFNPRTASGPR